MLLQSIVTPNKAVKPFVAALLTRTLSTPHLLRHGWPMSPEQARSAERPSEPQANGLTDLLAALHEVLISHQTR